MTGLPRLLSGACPRALSNKIREAFQRGTHSGALRLPDCTTSWRNPRYAALAARASLKSFANFIAEISWPVFQEKYRKGFTLIEVMISMFIMAMLTILVSTSIRTAVQNKKKIEDRVKTETILYDTLRVLKLDIERAFHYQDVFWEIENLAIQQLENEQQNPGGQGQGQVQGGFQRTQQPAFGANPNVQQRQPPVQLTQFLGEKNSLHFTSLNNFRTKYNAPESDQMEVGFYLESCERRDGKGNTQCLWRRSSPQIDDEVDKGGTKVVVAEHVQKFQLRYRDKREDGEWVDQWRSDNKGRSDHRNKFPHFVEVEIEIEDEDDKRSRKVSQTMVVSLAFPNNQTHIQQQQQQQQLQQNSGAFQ